MVQGIGTNRGQPGVPQPGPRQLGVAAVEAAPIFREGLCAVVHRAPGLHWLGHASTHHSSLQMCEQLRPDVVLVDSGLDPRGHLVRLLAAGESTAPTVVVLVRDAQRSARYLGDVFAAGAHAALPRSAEPRRLAEGIHRAHTDRRFVDPSLTALATVGSTRPGAGPVARPRLPLSRREYQVLQLLAEGMENSAIAKTLYLSVETVRTHVKSILRKLPARDRTHAVAVAFRSGILVVHPEDSAGGTGTGSTGSTGNAGNTGDTAGDAGPRSAGPGPAAAWARALE
ncbi:DNA-binding response regulator, NarL/FixJ family, contains REC and HTH domains [Amycolatopsis arida]|uniref:DNA-binding response regulator, NarL/FixJ family, contains REC and HTH domains n=1 Tax=Amycolatopsis arida TaxID=587909 RepID=A0A1I5TJY7_9PSEU|nr:response regulator transcription factor [Amycolatopsis arida]TDX96070.1 DNA-binding NarL/FixJ family response regulator [Amycolatopsis arida]SFP83278.1 DNA-binding response regulator, NarL/FixJ family, contains REC and HTH domains [Amycolatopsis arida]